MSSSFDRSTVVRPRALIGALAFDDSGLLIDLPIRQTHQVNPTALAVWACLDGATPLGSVVDELALTFAMDPAAIEPDVLAVIAQFEQMGLVEIDGPADELTELAADPASRLGAPTPLSPCIGRNLVELDGGRYIMLPPSSCQDGLDRRGWRPTLAIAVGDHRIGIRGNSAATDTVLRHVFARHVVDDPRVAPNYSVVVVDDATIEPGSTHPRSGLYEGNQWLATSTEPMAIVEALARRISASVPSHPSWTCVDALAVVGDTGAVLLPWHQGTMAERVVALGERPGWMLHPAPVWVDVARGQVIIEPADLDLDLSAVGGPVHRQPSEPLPLTGIVTQGPTTARLDPPDAVIALVPWLVVAPADDVDAVLDTLAELTAGVPVLSAPFDDVGDVAAALIRSR